MATVMVEQKEDYSVSEKGQTMAVSLGMLMVLIQVDLRVEQKAHGMEHQKGNSRVA